MSWRWPKIRLRRTPVVLQMEEAECGAAALAIVLAYHGQVVPLARLRQECGVSRDGVRASDILAAARRHGLEARGFSKGLLALGSVPTPCIAFWEFRHYLVIEHVARDYVRVNDPGVGRYRLTREEFDAGYTGVVLTFAPGPGFRRGGRRPSVAAALWRKAGGGRRALAFAALLGVLGVVPEVVQASVARAFVDSVIVGGRHAWVAPLLGAMAAVFAYQIAVKTLISVTLLRVRTGLAARLHADYFWRLLHLPPEFYTQRDVGEVVDRSRLNESVIGMVADQLTRAAVHPVSAVVLGAVLVAQNAPLAAVGLSLVLLDFAIVRAFSGRQAENGAMVAKATGKVRAATIEAIRAVETLKASGLEDNAFRVWAGHFATASNAQVRLSCLDRWMLASSAVTDALAVTATILVGGLQVMRGEMTVGSLLAFNLLLGSFLRPVQETLMLWGQSRQLGVILDRVEDVLSYDLGEPPPGRPGPPTAGAVRPRRLRGRLECRSLRFGYGRSSGAFVSGFELAAEPGEWVAIVGRSGSGKSTITRLVAGLYRPWSGSILLDGEPRERLDRDLIAGSVAVVEQRVHLFSGTIRENLTLWDDVSRGRREAACRDAAILDEIQALPAGMETVLEEGGANLSGGQRQRLEIARALIVDPSILILDEATSALDAQTEATVLANLARRGCTCIMVAHRASAIRHCHQVVVLDEGRVVERGRYAGLAAAGGPLARLLQEHPHRVPPPQVVARS